MKTRELNKLILVGVLGTLLCAATMAQNRTATTNSSDQMELIKRVSVPGLIQASNRTETVSIGNRGPARPVELLAHRCDFHTGTGSGENRTVQLVEFEIRETEGGQFRWCCWESANSHPHAFRVFVVEGGTPYACYVSSEGVKLFRVTDGNESDAARRLFRENRAIWGEIKPLRIGFLREAVGREAFYTENALYDAITVNQISEAGADLHVTLHGNRADRKFTFAFSTSAGKWRLVEN